MGEWLSKEEAAESIGVSPKTVQRWIAQGKLKVFRKGRVLRIRKAELEAFMMKVDLSAILIPPEEAAKSGTIDDGAVEPLPLKSAVQGEFKAADAWDIGPARRIVSLPQSSSSDKSSFAA